MVHMVKMDFTFIGKGDPIAFKVFAMHSRKSAADAAHFNLFSKVECPKYLRSYHVLTYISRDKDQSYQFWVDAAIKDTRD